MAQSRLRAAAGCATVLAAGAGAELASPGSALPLTGADYAVGAGFALASVWLRSDRASWRLSLATAASWFAGTAAAALPGLPAYVADVAVLAYRGFLVHLLVRALGRPAPGRGATFLIAAGYLAVLLPVPAVGLVTAALAVALAAVTGRAARRAPADRRPVLIATAVCTAALAACWSLAAAGAAGPGLQLGNDLVLLSAATVPVVCSAQRGWLPGAISALIVELGPSDRRAAPVSAQLAKALADPDLEVRYAVPGLGWFDEAGQPVEAPPADRSGDGVRVTRVAAPAGGEVAVLHGSGGFSRIGAGPRVGDCRGPGPGQRPARRRGPAASRRGPGVPATSADRRRHRTPSPRGPAARRPGWPAAARRRVSGRAGRPGCGRDPQSARHRA